MNIWKTNKDGITANSGNESMLISAIPFVDTILPADPPSFSEIKSILELAVQKYLDSQAQLKGYDSIISACSYAAAANTFQTEGLSFLNWRADCWTFCYSLLDKVNSGTASIPTESQLISMLPIRV